MIKTILRSRTCRNTAWISAIGWLLVSHALAQTPTAPVSVDSLQWLEKPRDPKALAWAKQQTRSTVQRLESTPLYPAFKKELDAVLTTSPPEPQVILMGRRAMRFLVTKDEPYGRLQVATRNAAGVPMQWKTVLDVAELRKREGVPFEMEPYLLSAKSCLPPGYDKCLLSLSLAGSDEVQIREFDLDRGDFVKGGFSTPTSKAMATWLNKDTVMFETVKNSEHTTISGWPTDVRLWHRGESLGDAKVIYRGKATDALLELDAAGTGASRYGLITRAIDYTHFDLLTVDQDGKTERLPFAEDALKPMGLQALNARDVIVQLAKDVQLDGHAYPAETLLAYAIDPSLPQARRVSMVYTPAAGEFVEGGILGGGIVATAGQVSFVVSRHLVQQIVTAAPSGHAWTTRKVLQGVAGTTLSLAADPASNDLDVTTTGFVTPTRQEMYRQGRAPILLAQDKAILDGSRFVTEIRSATSKDGTSIDYFLLRPRVETWKGAQPLLVTGYAAFGISFKPDYFGPMTGGPALKLWLERGGSLMIPAARGGGERGEAWHRAAMREHRQNSYDDFIAAIESLIHEGYTMPSRIGFFGMSNGGLLAAVMGTERPDLFGAIVSDVPLTDLIRLKYMGMGGAWLDEYGDAANPAMRAVLEKYSPLQNVRAGVKYPPFLITTSTADDRVGPGHARKFAARLESVGAPVYFYEDTEGGHVVSNAFRNPELMAMRMTFLVGNLMGKTY